MPVARAREIIFPVSSLFVWTLNLDWVCSTLCLEIVTQLFPKKFPNNVLRPSSEPPHCPRFAFEFKFSAVAAKGRLSVFIMGKI